MLAKAFHRRPRTLRWLVLAGSLAALVAGATGCQSPLAEQRMNKRLESIQEVGRVYAASEARRPDNLREAGRFIVSNERRHAERLDANARWFGEMGERDVKRFEKRLPEYGEKIGELMWGKPEEIEENAIILFF